MENGVFYLMLAFGGMLLLYALALGISGDIQMIPRHYAVKVRNKKRYARRMGLGIGLIATAPLSGGLAGITVGPVWGLIVLVGGLVLMFWVSIHFLREELPGYDASASEKEGKKR